MAVRPSALTSISEIESVCTSQVREELRTLCPLLSDFDEVVDLVSKRVKSLFTIFGRDLPERSRWLYAVSP